MGSYAVKIPMTDWEYFLLISLNLDSIQSHKDNVGNKRFIKMSIKNICTFKIMIRKKHYFKYGNKVST